MENKTNITAWTIASEIELTYKSKVKASERPSIKDSKEAYDVSHRPSHLGLHCT